VLWGDTTGTPFDTVWTVINNGVPASYKIHIKSYDTNGVNFKPVRYYWQDASVAFDSTITDPAIDKAKTNIDSTTWPFRSGEANKGKALWIYGRDDDGLLRGGEFVIFADSAPPAPVVTFSIGSAGGVINWRGKDAKDGNQTKYEILLKKGTIDPVEPADIISQYNAGANYSAATVGGFDFSYSFITQGTGEYHCQVIAKDARGTISKSTVVISAY